MQNVRQAIRFDMVVSANHVYRMEAPESLNVIPASLDGEAIPLTPAICDCIRSACDELNIVRCDEIEGEVIARVVNDNGRIRVTAYKI